MKKKYSILILLLCAIVSAYGQTDIGEKSICIALKSKHKFSSELCDLIHNMSGWKDKFDKINSITEDTENLKSTETLDKSILNSGSFDLIEKKLDELKIRIDGFDINKDRKEILPTFPTFEEINNKNPKSLLKTYKNAENHIISYKDEIKKQKMLLNDLKSSVIIVNNTLESLHILGRELERLSETTGGGWTEVSNLLGFAALDIRNKLKPTCKHIKNALNDHIKDLNQDINLESSNYENLRSNTLLLIQNDVNAFQKGLDKNYAKIERLNLDFTNDLNGKLNNMETNFQKKKELNNQLKATNILSNDVNIKINRYNILLEELKKLQKKRKKLSDNIQNLKFKCPNNYTINNCKHNDIKNIFHSTRNSLNSEYSNIKLQIRKKENEIDMINKEIRNERNSIAVKRQKIDEQIRVQQNIASDLADNISIESFEKLVMAHTLTSTKLQNINSMMEKTVLELENISGNLLVE